MNNNLRLKFNSPQSVTDFVHILNKYDVTADLYSGRAVVDARSILGILSLDLSKPVELIIIGVSEKMKTMPNEILHNFVY